MKLRSFVVEHGSVWAYRHAAKRHQANAPPRVPGSVGFYFRKARCGIGGKQTFGTRLALPFGENRFGIANKLSQSQYGTTGLI
jgi:hypothetical protein